MNIRIDCDIEGHDGEYVEYKPIRYKHRRRYFGSMGIGADKEIWASVRDCLNRWKVTDADGNQLPDVTPDMEIEALDEMSDPMASWLIGSFSEALIKGRSRAQTAPFSEPSP